jgi:hypothetical protein
VLVQRNFEPATPLKPNPLRVVQGYPADSCPPPIPPAATPDPGEGWGAGGTRGEGAERGGRRKASTAWVAVLLCACALFAYSLVPRGMEAERLLAAEDDPVAIADYALKKANLDTSRVITEIDAALAAKDADLAKSFLDLAHERGIAVPPELAEKVEAAVVQANSAAAVAQRFALGFLTGEPEDVVGLSGTMLGDLFVFGDIRDAVREGSRLASGEKADELLLGLACVGLAVTAGTYATLGVGTPARVGLSVVKAARKTGNLSARMATWVGRSVREVVDWSSLRRAMGGTSLAEPAVAIRAARQSVKLDKAGGLLNAVKDVGRIQSKAGTKAALDGLKIAQGPRDVARVAKLADAKGGKTRAILKTLGRGAIALAVTSFNLTMWIVWALLALLGFVSSLKSFVERVTWRSIQRGKLRRARAEQERALAMAGQQG